MMKEIGSIIGRETGNKPFPLVVHRSAYLFANVETVIDIGAGTGRFAKYFLKGEYRCNRRNSNANSTNHLYEVKAPVKFPITKYIAIEPYPLFCAKLRFINDPRLEVVCHLWEEVRSSFIGRKFDAVILWDVAMYMDLRHTHNTSDPVEALLKELDVWINMANKFFLFSLHPVRGVIESDRFSDILRYLDTHPQLKLIDELYLNRIYGVRHER